MSTGQAGAEIGIGIGTTLNCNHEAPIVYANNPVRDVAGCLNSAGGHAVPGNSIQDTDQGYLLPVTHSLRGEGFDASEDGTGRGTPLVPVAFAHQAGGAQTTLGYDQERGTAPTLSKCQTPAIAYSMITANTGANGLGVAAEVAPTLDRAQPCAVAAFKGGQGSGAGSIGYSEHLAPTLPSADGGNRTHTLMQFMQVRRLTPRECERLQGFPDDYTLIPHRNKPAADGPRYKALGNSMAVPVMAWIGKRIQQVEDISA
jgi:DNA (cytosine-5)-methyltransferase 1